jgi:hypothetical protein
LILIGYFLVLNFNNCVHCWWGLTLLTD